MSADLPTGWAWAPLAELAAPVRNAFTIGPFGSSLKVADYRETGVPLVFVRDIRGGAFGGAHTKFIGREKANELQAHSVRAGDLLVTKMGEPPGDTAVYPSNRPPAVITADCIKLTPNSTITSSAYLRFSIKSPVVHDQILEQTMGVAQQKLSLARFKQVQVPLPPIPEQRRIVAKVEALLEQVNRAKGRLERVPLILKRFRQAVLAAACSGKLTREWREAHPNTPSADGLLSSIATRRRELGLPTATKAIEEQDILMPESELPEKWTWCRVGQVADVRLGGTPSRKEPSYWRGKIPWISSGEVANCRIRDTAEKITQKGLTNSNAKLYPAGTVLIAMIGEGKTRGQVAILDIEACTNQNAAGIVFDAGMINSEYIWLWGLGEYERNRDVGRGGNQPALNGAKVRALPLPLPPLEEQAEIVRAAQALLKIVSIVECRLEEAVAKAEKIPGAILARAFSGELVPTEAELARAERRTYETAEALLARVHTSEEDPDAVTTSRRSSAEKPRRRVLAGRG